MKYKLEEISKEVPNEFKKKSLSQISSTILSHYFTIQDKTVIVRLNFDTFSELIDQSIGDDSVEKLNSVLFDKLAEVFALIPRKFAIEVDVYINDFENYGIDEAERIVKDNIALLIYSLVIERRKKIITGLSLLGGGVALLLISYFLNEIELPQILFDIINISGTLLVWESANITLIERSADRKRTRQYLSKFKNIKLIPANSESATSV